MFCSKLFFHSLDAYIEAQEIIITTFPFLPKNTVATNFVNLQIISSISESAIGCNWEKDDLTSAFYSNNCLPDVSNAEYSSVCEEDGNSITFTYTTRTPLRDEVVYGVFCFFPNLITTAITIQAQGTKLFAGIK